MARPSEFTDLNGQSQPFAADALFELFLHDSSRAAGRMRLFFIENGLPPGLADVVENNLQSIRLDRSHSEVMQVHLATIQLLEACGFSKTESGQLAAVSNLSELSGYTAFGHNLRVLAYFFELSAFISGAVRKVEHQELLESVFQRPASLAPASADQPPTPLETAVAAMIRNSVIRESGWASHWVDYERAMLPGVLLHDAAKIVVPFKILRDEPEYADLAGNTQPTTELDGRLTPEARRLINAHVTEAPIVFAAISQSFTERGKERVRQMMPGIAGHHDWYDGSDPLSGHALRPTHSRYEELPLSARLIAICDVLDALASERRYQKRRATGVADEDARATRKPLSLDEAIRYLHHQSGQQFDPLFVSVLEHLASQPTTRARLEEIRTTGIAPSASEHDPTLDAYF